MAAQLPLFLNLTDGAVEQVKTGDVLDPTRLGAGTPDATKFLRGDSQWVVPSGGAGGGLADYAIFGGL